jgi:hypothetical protein
MDVVLCVPCIRVLSAYNEALASRYVCVESVGRERKMAQLHLIYIVG